MHRSLLLLYCVLCVFAITAEEKNEIPAEVEAVFKNANSIELHSINPHVEQEEVLKHPGFLYGISLGKTVLKVEEGRELFGKLKASTESNKAGRAKCFIPHHALIAKSGDKTALIVICFMCNAAFATLDINKSRTEFLPGRELKAVFNKLLTDAKIPMPKEEPE